VAVDVDQLERLQVGDAALLRRERLAERIGPFPLGDDQPRVDLSLELPEERLAMRQGEAVRRGKVGRSGVAARPGRPLRAEDNPKRGNATRLR
jgi:hypothetical protein